MNTVRYRITNPWGLHARPCAYIVSLATTCAREWEVIVSVRGVEADAKSILSLMMLAAGYGSEVEFLSLMPDERWEQFTASLEALFFVVDHRGNKINAYEPVERVLKAAKSGIVPSCLTMRADLLTRARNYNCGPFFERVDEEGQAAPSPVALLNSQRLVTLDKIDAFISYDSRDFSYAVSIYDALLDRGLSVFIAGASLPSSATSDFQLAIEEALTKATSMIVVATDAVFLDGGWVRAEWTTFLNEKRAGRKAGNLVIVKPTKVSMEDLPVMLRMYQAEDIPEYGPTSVDRIDRLIKLLNVPRA